jgi:adenylosuccinate lyase
LRVKYRVLVEIEYFIALCSALPNLGVKFSLFDSLHCIYQNFSTKSLWLKTGKSNQPRCKKIEYFIKECFWKLSLSQYKEFIHFGLFTSIILRLYKRSVWELCNALNPLTIKLNWASEWKRRCNACTHTRMTLTTDWVKKLAFLRRLEETNAFVILYSFAAKFGSWQIIMHTSWLTLVIRDIWRKLWRYFRITPLLNHTNGTYDHFAAFLMR